MFNKKQKITEEYLENIILEGLGEPLLPGQKAKPNMLEILKAKTGLNRIRNERVRPE